MKKSLSILLFLATILAATVFGACGNFETVSSPDTAPAFYTYSQTADEGITLTATQGETIITTGSNVTDDKSVTITAVAETGTVKLFVNGVLQTNTPYTVVPSENIEVRAELWYAVKAKILKPDGVDASAIVLQENGFDAVLNENLEYVTSARVGTKVTFKAMAAGWEAIEQTVTVDGEKRAELSFTTPEIVSYGGITKAGTEYFAEGIDFGNAIFEGLSDTNYVFSFKAKNIEAGDYDIISFGAIVDYIHEQSHTAVEFYYAPLEDPAFYGFEYITFNSWDRSTYTAQSNVDVKAAIDEAKAGTDGYITFDVIRNNDTFYVFVNGTYCVQIASENILGTATPIKNRASSFGFFTRAKTKCVFYDVNFALGEDAVTAKLEQSKVSIPAATATNGSVSVVESAYENQIIYATLTPNQGYRLESVTVGGVDMTDKVVGGVLTFYAKEDAAIAADFVEIPASLFTVSGKIDVKTYGIPYNSITATSDNGNEVAISDDYTYSVLAEEGDLTLTFEAQNFAKVTETISVTGEGSGKDVVINEPILTIWAPAATSKTGVNQYTIEPNKNVIFNPSAFLGISSEYWTIESKVSLNVGDKTDYGVGFMVGSGDCAIVLANVNGVWQVEMISSSADVNLWGLKRVATSNNISEAMEAAKTENGTVTIKAVRAGTIIGIFVNGIYAGAFMTGEYVSDKGVDLGLNGKAGFVGLYARGDIGCVFDDVWYNLDETTAKNAFNGITTVKGTETMSDWGISVNQDGTATSAGTADFASAGYATVSSTAWVMEATISGVEIGNDWGVWSAGFLVHGWTSSMLNLYYDSAQQTYGFEAIQTADWHRTLLEVKDGVDIKSMMERAMNEGTLKLQVVRAGAAFYVFANDVLATTATLTDFGITGALDQASHSFGLYTRANTKCTFSNISYSVDRIDVYNAIKGIL